MARRYGLKLADLTDEQVRLLTAYWLLCDAEPPTVHEELPLEYGPALNELSRIAGKYQRSAHSKRDYKMCGNQGRKVRVSVGRGALATAPGGR